MINKDELKDLQKAQAELEYQKDVLAKKHEIYLASTSHLREIIRATEDQIESIKATLKAQGLDEYAETGSKKLTGGLGIRCGKTLDYDEAKAFAFAKEKDMFLQLDKKSFEKAAPSLGLDFVTQSEKISVTFPKEIKLEELDG